MSKYILKRIKSYNLELENKLNGVVFSNHSRLYNKRSESNCKYRYEQINSYRGISSTRHMNGMCAWVFIGEQRTRILFQLPDDRLTSRKFYL